jgi:hypothetical protein
LHIGISDKATLPGAAACFCATTGLQIVIANEAALTRATTIDGATIGLLIGILNKTTIARLRLRRWKNKECQQPD